MKTRISIIIIVALVAGSLILLNTNIFWNILNPIFYRDLLNKYAGIHKIDPLLVAAIIRVESKFLPQAQSPVGAIGLMQIMPETGREIAGKLKMANFRPHDLYVPEINIQIGFYYLSELKKEFGDDTIAILASYNAGKNKVKVWKAGNDRLTIAQIEFKETRNFVKSVLHTYNWLKLIQKFKQIISVRW